MAEEIDANYLIAKFMCDLLPAADGCIGFMGGQKARGYGSFQYGRKRFREYAHRFAYKQSHGEIPPRHEVDHLCGVTLCVNSLHLEAVPHQVNLARGAAWKLIRKQIERLARLGVEVEARPLYKRAYAPEFFGQAVRWLNR